MHTAAIGLWLYGGSRHQSRQQSGYAHLLEHLLFRGTQTVGGRELRQRFAALGGAVNAQTGRELTAWYGLVAEDAVGECLALFLEMLLEPGFNDADIHRERQVILREIAEEPPDLIEFCLARLWPRDSLSWPIRGHQDTLETADITGLQNFLEEKRQGRRLVVSASGAIDHGTLVEICQPLARLPAGTPLPTPSSLSQVALTGFLLQPEPTQALWVIPIPGIRDNRYTALQTLMYLFAGGPASRLWEALRERQSWIYGFDSVVHSFTDTGVWLLRIQSAPEQIHRIVEQVKREFDRLISDPPSKTEMDLCRRHFQARLALEQDDPQAVMERLGREALLLEKVREPEQLHDEIENVMIEELVALTMNIRLRNRITAD